MASADVRGRPIAPLMPTSLSCRFYADFRFMDQSGRALVRRTHQKADPARWPLKCFCHKSPADFTWRALDSRDAVFSPEVKWSGSSRKRSGSFAQAVQMAS